MGEVRYVCWRGMVREGTLDENGGLTLGVIPVFDCTGGRTIRQVSYVAFAPGAHRSFATREECERDLAKRRPARR